MQLALDIEPMARRSDPQTSKAAAREAKELAARHHAQILAALKKQPDGLTVHEIAAFCRMDAHAVGKRMNELEKAMLVETIIIANGDSPDGYECLTRPSPSGRQARVWRLS